MRGAAMTTRGHFTAPWHVGQNDAHAHKGRAHVGHTLPIVLGRVTGVGFGSGAFIPGILSARSTL